MNSYYFEEIHTELDAFEIYKLFYKKDYSFILDSNTNDNKLGRYSFIGLEPFIRIESKKGKIKIQQNKTETIITEDPFKILKELLDKYKIKNSSRFPLIGGAVGFFAYDLCHHLEKLPKTATDQLNLPDMMIGFYDVIIVIDHLENKKFAVSVELPDNDKKTAIEKVKNLKSAIKNKTSRNYLYLNEVYQKNNPELVSNFSKESYCQAIHKVKEYIRTGDVYQINMTQCFSTLINKHPLNIYEKLRCTNPAPFSAYLEYKDFNVLCSSPERFIKLTNGIVETRPIKGTIARGKNKKEDSKNQKILQKSMKDQAENVMIVDLLRNDVGKVCKFSSVKVPELFHIEKYATVFHLVSTVTGELKDGFTAIDCLKAAFPGGSITGAPKIRAMEIIDELEPTKRHLYTGCIGYIGFDGNMDLNIVIRTILIKNDHAYYQVGGGIVWDSIPEKEYQETLDKGSALKEALFDD